MSNLIKQIRFDGDVLDVLRNMEWNDEGKLGVIRGGQLARDLYVKVNKALEAMGGKWNRSKGGHVFQGDPRESVEGLLESGVVEVERDGFFETPTKVVMRMLELVEPHSYILEPSAGMGAILDVIPGLSTDFICVEKNPNRAKELEKQGFIVHCMDFLDFETDLEINSVFMNPPFENQQDIDHVKHAFDLLSPGGRMVSVMSSGAFFREDKKATEFRNWLCGKGGYSEPLPEGSFKESGTGVNAVLVAISKATL